MMGRKRNIFSDMVLHSDWPISAKVRKVKDPRNRATFIGGSMALNPR